MAENYDPASFKKISEQFFEKYMASYRDSFNSSVRFFLEPLDEIHLGSIAQRDLPRGSTFYIYAFSAIALFVLAVAGHVP